MKPTPQRSALFIAITALLVSTPLLAQSGPSADGADDQTRSLGSVQVKGEYIPEPMLDTSEVASFVTEADLERTGDDTAAKALTRVAGLSMANDKHVFVRGLNERYSNAMFNGSPLPSPEPMQRVVPLDLFPADVLQGITVQKTYSARYPGEFGGGVIDLKSLAIPRRNFVSLSISGGGNTATTFEKGLTYYGSRSDYWGYDDGSRKIPGPLAEAMAQGKRVDLGNFSREDIRRIGRSFQNANFNLLQENDSIGPDFGFGASAGYSADMGNGARLGLVAAGGFDNSWRTRFGQQQEGYFTAQSLELDRDYEFASTQNDARVNMLLGVGVESGKHRFGATTLYVHDTRKETRSRSGVDILFSSNEVRDDYTEWFERNMLSHQLSGEHGFGEYGDFTIEWRVASARARRDAPYEKGIRYEKVDGYWVHDGSRQQNYTRFSKVDDHMLSAGIDFGYRLPLESRDVKLSGGFAWSDNDRNAEAREFRFLALDGALPFLNRYQRPDYLFSDYNLSLDLLRLRETTGGFGAAAYDANLEVRAGYLQAEVEFAPTLRATVGVRREDASQSVTPYDIFTGAPDGSLPVRDNAYTLPAATLTWNFAENQQLRFGASKTITRPQFRELAPQQYNDPDTDRLYYGNPYLVDSELRNLDLRYEWFFRPGQHLTAALFHKSIDKPIEANINEAGGTIFQSYLNAPSARLHGVELEFKSYLGEAFQMPLMGSDNRLFLGANYTWSKSRIRSRESDTVQPYGYDAPIPARLFVRDGVAMQGQSEHIANLQFGLENPTDRSQAMLIANYVSERITARGRPGQPDYMEKPGLLLDLALRKSFDADAAGNLRMSVGLSLRNLLGTDHREYQERDGHKVDVNRYAPGRSYSLSLSASF
ncbi:TonB-dependent receptor domain-containing protein [Luteimonas sp. e5]